MKQLLVSLLILLSSTSVAETSLWKVSKGGSYLYLAGTVHLLSAKDLPFPTAFDRAYEDADLLAFETDISQLDDPAIQFRLMSSLAYTDGTFLNQKISSKLYQQLNDYLRSRGLMPNMFLSMKPSGVMMTMLSIEFKRLGITQEGADSFYFRRAQREGKAVVSLESVSDHLSFIANMGEGNEEMFLQQTLDDVYQIEPMMDEIVSSWKRGDGQALEKLVVEDMRINYPRLYKSLLVDRNLNWLPILKQMSKTQEVEMVLVGVAHVVGRDGLLNMLQQQGFTIQKM